MCCYNHHHCNAVTGFWALWDPYIQECNVILIIPQRQLISRYERANIKSMKQCQTHRKEPRKQDKKVDKRILCTVCRLILCYLQDFRARVPSTKGLQGCHCNILQACTVVPCSNGSRMTVWVGSLMSQKLCHERHRSHPATLNVATIKCFDVKGVPCHHGMVRLQVADGSSLQIWRVAVTILHKKSRTDDEERSSSLWVGWG
jgi:hypothetical protein